jgi:hypothetical protein
MCRILRFTSSALMAITECLFRDVLIGVTVTVRPISLAPIMTSIFIVLIYLHIRIEIYSKKGLLDYSNSAYTKSSILAFCVIGLALFLVAIVYLFQIGDLKMLNYVNCVLFVNFTMCAVVPTLLIIKNSNMIEYAKNNFWK